MQSSKQSNLLITTSILDSYRWYKICPPNWRDRAYKSLVSSIRREGYKPHKTAARGIEFEKAVYRKAGGGSELFNEIVGKCSGGRPQQVTKKTIQVQGRDVLLYGKIDVLFPHKIVDIKTTENYRGDDKYLGGWQHKIYLLCTGLNQFEYLVALFEPFPSNRMITYYETPYINDDHKALKEEVIEGIEEFFEWLKVEGLFYDYETIFSNPWGKR